MAAHHFASCLVQRVVGQINQRPAAVFLQQGLRKGVAYVASFAYTSEIRGGPKQRRGRVAPHTVRSYVSVVRLSTVVEAKEAIEAPTNRCVAGVEKALVPTSTSRRTQWSAFTFTHCNCD